MKKYITFLAVIVCLQGFAQSAVDLYCRANAQVQYQDYKQAIEWLNKAIEAKPDYADAYFLRGDCHYFLKEYDAAIQDYLKDDTFKKNRSSYNLACTYALLGKVNEAFKALEANLGSEYKLRMQHVQRDGDLESLRKDARWDALVKKQWYSPYEIALNEADEKLATNDIAGALDLQSKAINLEPKNARAYGARAISYLRSGDMQKGLDDLNMAIGLDPKSVYFGNRAYANNKLSNRQQALADYEKAVQLDPTNLVYYDLGIARYQNGSKGSALEAVRKHITYFNRDEMGLYFGGIICSEMDQFDEALGYFNKAIEFNDGVPDIYLKRGDVFYLTKKYQEAVNDYSKVIQLDPSNGGAYYVRGNAKGSLYDKKGACADWIKAQELGYKDTNGYIRDLCK